MSNRHGSAVVTLPSDTEILITRQFDARTSDTPLMPLPRRPDIRTVPSASLLDDAIGLPALPATICTAKAPGISAYFAGIRLYHPAATPLLPASQTRSPTVPAGAVADANAGMMA